MGETELAIKLDLPYLDKIKDLIIVVARSYGLNPCIVAGIVSRESGGGRFLGKWGNPEGTGDKGHGRGLMQADDRYWQGLLNLDAKGGEEDAWKYPAFNIAFGCWLLAGNIKKFHVKGATNNMPLRAAIAAYNCGGARVAGLIQTGRDIDSRTTGRDYSADVLKRAGLLAEQGWPED